MAIAAIDTTMNGGTQPWSLQTPEALSGVCRVFPRRNAGTMSASIAAGMLAGADCVDDLDLLRHGAVGRLFDGCGHHRHWGPSYDRSLMVTSSNSMLSRHAYWQD
nr:hypothetical protein [Rhodococcus ruber]